MRILHVGSGFRPWRRGGLTAYVEDLMAAQVARGDEVAYVFAGRQYPRRARRLPRLRRWSRDDVPMYEVVDSPLFDHGRQPLLEVAEPAVERLLAEVVEEVRPDVVHVQEIAGLPSSVLDVAGRLGAATVVTLQDYFWVCPTFRVLAADGSRCLEHATGAECLGCAAAEPRGPEPLFEATVTYDLERLAVLRDLDADRRDPAIRRLARAVGRRAAPTHGPQGDGEAYRRRREANVRRLNEAGRVIAMSSRVAEIHAHFGVDPARMAVVHLTLEHIAALRPRTVAAREPLVLATLAAFESESKGARLVLDTLERLGSSPAAGRFRLLVFGHSRAAFVREAERFAEVEVRGPYTPAQLDRLLDEVDVGLMPSVWEEAYGYAGVEFLAKGIPVVANAIGGMPDYVRDGETGLLNRSCSAEELARLVEGLVERPDRVAELGASVRAARGELVKTMGEHAAEMDAVYRALAGDRLLYR